MEKTRMCDLLEGIALFVPKHKKIDKKIVKNIKLCLNTQHKVERKYIKDMTSEQKLQISKLESIPLHQFNRKIKRSFVPERVIDLHGYNIEKAYENLISFCIRCIDQNIKHIIVITGGNALRHTVLRTMFIDMMQRDLKKYVVSYTQSNIQHGGEGAFYVILKTKK